MPVCVWVGGCMCVGVWVGGWVYACVWVGGWVGECSRVSVCACAGASVGFLRSRAACARVLMCVCVCACVGVTTQPKPYNNSTVGSAIRRMGDGVGRCDMVIQSKRSASNGPVRSASNGLVGEVSFSVSTAGVLLRTELSRILGSASRTQVKLRTEKEVVMFRCTRRASTAFGLGYGGQLPATSAAVPPPPSFTPATAIVPIVLEQTSRGKVVASGVSGWWRWWS